jgi:hypothetical protein
VSLLLVIACVLLLLAGFGVHWARHPGLHFGWLGMALWCLSILLPIPRLGVYQFGIEWLIVVVLVVVIIVLLVRPRQP